MHDIFLSYSSKDRERLIPLVDALEAQGWTVFWDHRSIKVADDWHQVIGNAIQQSTCVIVVWSENSVQSKWVMEEALIAKERGVLYPIFLDMVTIPFGFTLLQAANFIGWNGDASQSEFVELKEQLSIRFQSKSQKIVKPSTTLAKSSSKIKLLGLVVLIAVGVGGYPLISDREGEPATSKDEVAINVQAVATSAIAEPKMVLIPEGSFTMGCEDKDAMVCRDVSKPSHKVNVGKFLMSETEVTVAQFRAFAEAESYKTTAEERGSCWSFGVGGKWSDAKGNSWRKMGFPQEDNHPVACVSYNDAKAYVRWLNDKTGKKWRLPSEAEWEYAIRAGTKTVYYWGDVIGKNNANCSQSKCGDKFGVTSPVASFSPNQFGLYDMSGNVWEWVEDKWHRDYNNVPTDGGAWTADDSSSHTKRGGSWNSGLPLFLTPTYRLFGVQDSRDFRTGFRVASDYK